jgi:hypothetical protein
MNDLVMFTIYDHPRDHPDWYVTRRLVVRSSVIYHDTQAVLSRTLEDARRAVPAGLYCLGRMPEHDPCIVESWV